MSKNVTDILKEVTKDILSEDNLKEIETAFNATVNDKVKIHVEKALNEQDEDYAKKLEKLVEVIDADHTTKLNQVVEAIDKNHAQKLKTIVGKYEKTIKEEASAFKSNLVAQVSKYLEIYLEEKIPAKQIQEAVNNKKAAKILGDMRNMLSVNEALAKDSIRDAVIEGKNRLDEAVQQLEAANKKVEQLTQSLTKAESETILEKKLSTLEKDKKAYMKKMLSGKSSQFINENFDYTLKLFEKSEEERLANLKEEAVNEAVSQKVDRPVIEETVQKEEDNRDPSFGLYLKELNKY
ncbi:hypothetical protein EBR43_03990 [bacterium]|nr:hypothetical protein [bacterium]